MKSGHTEYDFETETIKPRIGEFISIGDDHYEVKFIQYIFNDYYEFEHLLVTAKI